MGRVKERIVKAVGWCVVIVIIGGVVFCDRWVKDFARDQEVERALRRRDAQRDREIAQQEGEGAETAADRAAAAVQVEGPGAPSSVTRVADAPAVDGESSLDELTAKMKALSREVEQLRRELAEARAELRATDPVRRQLAEHVAANSLRYADQWLDLIEAASDGERVTEDLTRLFAPLLALLKVTGLASAEQEGDARSLRPEPSAPDAALTIQREVATETERVTVTVAAAFARAPADWIGEPLDCGIDLEICWRVDGGYDVTVETSWTQQFGRAGARFELRSYVVEGRTLQRQPWHGGAQSRDLTPDEFPDLRAAVEQLLAELRTIAG